MKFTHVIILTILFFSCGDLETDTVEKHQKSRDNIINVSTRIFEIDTDPTMVIGRSCLYIINDYLIVCDSQSPDKGIHIFNKNTFEYMTSAGTRGKGPNEIVRYGDIGVDHKNKLFYMSDYGKMIMYRFDLDSVLANENYMPTKSFVLGNELFPTNYEFVNDSIILGTGAKILDNHTFKHAIVECNIQSGESKEFGDHHPDIDQVNLTTYFASSIDQGIIVQGHQRNDLMTISNLKGELLHNIYGPQWEKSKTKNGYYYVTQIMGNTIVASFRGGLRVSFDQNQRPRGVLPTKLLLFDKKGNYKKTLETENGVHHFCVDNENKRVIAYFGERDNPLGYIDLNGVVE